jgi:hypothetical protein
MRVPFRAAGRDGVFVRGLVALEEELERGFCFLAGLPVGLGTKEEEAGFEV